MRTVVVCRHYLFTAPKVSRPGEQEKMCLTLFDVPETGELNVELTDFGDKRVLHTQLVSGVAGKTIGSAVSSR